MKTQIQAIDFSKVDEASWQSLASKLSTLDIDILGIEAITHPVIKNKLSFFSKQCGKVA